MIRASFIPLTALSSDNPNVTMAVSNIKAFDGSSTAHRYLPEPLSALELGLFTFRDLNKTKSTHHENQKSARLLSHDLAQQLRNL